ncbi:MAG: sigma-54-dependent Fis family transcriptional regulator [Acidobacteria bacterium]|nr:sigma-54-dependent Fis family transcriptional regulator [Acidobacteriota bacterium]
MTAPRVAVVDDDPLFSDYLTAMLRSRGYDAHAYATGNELLEALSTSRAPQVVLLDVLMPAMNGLEVLRAIRAAHPQVQVIMLSGQQVPATIVNAVRGGAFDYVVKPDDPDLGEAAIENAIISALDRIALETEVARLSASEVEASDGSQPSWGSGAAMQAVLKMVERVANSDVTVLISGESGVGKEVIARELHRRSDRCHKPFVKVNCAALPADLLESELVGHERGAFTGAQGTRIGKFEFAGGGTLMLDEIGELPAGLQAKLLHVLQDGEFTKLGSNRTVQVDARVIGATNRDLTAMIRAGTFREDLYYRLQVIEIHVPPLRERQDEIPALIEFFLRRYSTRYGRPAVRMSAGLRSALLSYSWPGNVRELENVIKRFVILQDETLVRTEIERSSQALADPLPPAAVQAGRDVAAAAGGVSAPSSTPVAMPAPRDGAVLPFPSPAAAAAGDSSSLPDLARAAAISAERDAITRALDQFHWNRRKAARLLGVSYKTLLNKMKTCGITQPGGSS